MNHCGSTALPPDRRQKCRRRSTCALSTLLALAPLVHAELYLNGHLGLRSQQVDRDSSLNSPLNGVDSNHFGSANVHSEWLISPYKALSSQIDVSAQRSDLADPRDDIRVNRAAVEYENGAGESPYRAQAGDLYANFSPRILRRNLKGALLDIQPIGGTSLQLLAGLNSSSWDTAGYASRFTGASWLAETRGLGDFSFSYVFSEDSDHGSEQRTSSLGWFNSFGEKRHRIDWEAEILHQSNLGEDGKGIYLQSNAQLFDNLTRISVTAERYDQHFTPRGAALSPDQKRWFANLSQRVGDSYLNLDMQSTSSLTSNSRDLSYSASYSLNFDNGLIANLRTGERIGSGFGSSTRSDSQSLQLNYALSANHSVSGGWQGVDSKTRFFSGKSHSRSSDWSLGSRSSGQFWGGQGYIAPTLVWRDLDSQTLDSREFSPAMSLGFRKNNHDLQLRYDGSFREADPVFTPATRRNKNRRFSFSYAYRHNNTDWRAEIGRFASHSNLIGDQRENSVMLSVNHRFSIDNQGRSLVRTGSNEFEGVVDPVLALGALIANGEYQLAQDIANSFNPVSRQQQADRSVYSGYFIRNAETPQQLELHKNGRFLDEVHLTIDLRGMDANRVHQLFETLHAYLHSRFGAPDTQQAAGDFDDNVYAAVSSGRLVRLMQWQLGTSELRFGLPPSGSGDLKLRISLNKHFLSALNGLWQG